MSFPGQLKSPRVMFKAMAFLCLTFLSSAKEPIKAVRTAGDYQITATLGDATPLSISSVIVKHGKQVIELPKSLFSDITEPHIGKSCQPTKFVVESKRSRLFIRFTAGGGQFPEDHVLILTLPLRTASRITRKGDVTGFVETRPSTPITQPKADSLGTSDNNPNQNQAKPNGLPISSSSATEIYAGEPLNEALHDLEKAATRVSHELSSASPTLRTDVYRLADGRLVAVTSRAGKPGQPYSIEALRVTSSATSRLTRRLPKVSSLTLPK